MKKIVLKKKFVVAIAGLLLLTFLIPASSHAAGVFLVPAAGLAIWGVTVVAAGVAALLDEDGSEAEADSARREPAANKPDPASASAPADLKLQPGEG
ncbi:MAG: hypothetical protein GY859_32290 [Desulfobacterales bacterium]|nr:hypothetical protein [Desulfobacterales bacterium]